MKAIQISKYGGPEVLSYKDLPKPEPAKGEVLVKIAASGVNFVDVYQRTGRYPLPLPFILGQEASGIVEAIGEGVTQFRQGDRVCYASHNGSYAEHAVVPEAKLVPVPDNVSNHNAAACLLQGMTAHYLSNSTYSIKKGDKVLIHAGAGGVGLLLTQIAKKLGAFIITTVSTEEKAALSKQAGADEVILYSKFDFEAGVKKITDGEGVHVVYDSVGKTTFEKSVNCLKTRGYMVLYGASSGAVPPFDPMILAAKGSIFITRPSLGHYTKTREELLTRAGDVLKWISDGSLKLKIDHVYPLEEAPQAHRELEGRETTGKLLLLV